MEDLLRITKQILNGYGPNISFMFETYEGTEYGGFVRKTDVVRFNEIPELIDSVKHSDNIGISSVVLSNDYRRLYMPMIDFKNKFDLCELDYLKEIFPEYMTDSILIYDSGNSYHGYIPRLMVSIDDWGKFMAKLLIVGPSNITPIIDVRWVGHRLIDGYSCLRWSNNLDKKPIKFIQQGI